MVHSSGRRTVYRISREWSWGFGEAFGIVISPASLIELYAGLTGMRHVIWNVGCDTHDTYPNWHAMIHVFFMRWQTSNLNEVGAHVHISFLASI